MKRIEADGRRRIGVDVENFPSFKRPVKIVCRQIDAVDAALMTVGYCSVQHCCRRCKRDVLRRKCCHPSTLQRISNVAKVKPEEAFMMPRPLSASLTSTIIGGSAAAPRAGAARENVQRLQRAVLLHVVGR
jgi:cysteine synthase